ncbi:MAG: MraY family glycosyltransferase [Bacteroidota bacterium]
MTFYLILLAGALVAAELVYFRLATRLRIIDRPNERSSHAKPTIRGGGIIFILAFGLWYLCFGDNFYLMASACSVAFISLLDDLKPQRAYVRFCIHAISMVVVFYSLSLFTWPWWLTMLALIVCIGTLNAFNFMDGINGITGLYSLVNLTSFYWINSIVPFASETLLATLAVAVTVFLYFNFRQQARCFAGDVGSVTLAFFQVFFLLQLIVATGNFWWPILFLLFGLDSVVTIATRLIRGENIFRPHRQHLYQYIANEMGYDHRLVSAAYAGVQLVLNVVLIGAVIFDHVWMALTLSALVVVFYLAVRHRVVQKTKTKP